MPEYFNLSEKDPAFLVEVWVLYGIGVSTLLLRFAIRLKTVGLRGFTWDDIFAFLVLCFYTIDAVTVHVVYWCGTNIEGLAILTERPLTNPEIEQLHEGSRQQLVAWYSYASLVWCLKGTMVCFFMRMTAGISGRNIVRWIGWACIISYVAVFLTITFGCWPYGGNFQITPDPGRSCTLKPQNFIVMTVLNVLTDAAILSVPLPMLWQLQIPNRQKIVIGILLSSGIFVITAAIIRIVITLGSAPSALTINRWGVRETIVGILAVNAPILRPMFSKGFWTQSGSYLAGSAGTKGHTTGTRPGDRPAPHGPYEMASSITSKSRGRERGTSFTGSEDSIITKAAIDGGAGARGSPSLADGVVVKTVYQVTDAPRSAGNSDRWEQGGFHQATAYGTRSPV